MGLDMYLHRKKYVGANFEHRNVTGEIRIKVGNQDLPIDFKKVSYIEEEVGYWRKANAIHNWFVNNVQDGKDDCKDYYVELSQLKELLDKCKEVKSIAEMKKGKVSIGMKMTEDGLVDEFEDGEYISNAEEVEKILPTKDGFFFGSTAYDEYYMQDIDYTIEVLSKLIEDEEKLNKNGIWTEFYYHSSW